MYPWMRASDADRQRVVDTLQGHTADGRLTLDEFAARADTAHRAVTYADLATLTTDLPGKPAAHSPSRSPVVATLVAAVIVLAVPPDRRRGRCGGRVGPHGRHDGVDGHGHGRLRLTNHGDAGGVRPGAPRPTSTVGCRTEWGGTDATVGGAVRAAAPQLGQARRLLRPGNGLLRLPLLRRQALREMDRVLRPSGLLLLAKDRK